MKLSEAIKILKANTMACWWPSKITGKNGTDFNGIFGEANKLLKDIMRRQNIPEDTKFFVLDETNTETKLYNEISTAILTVKQAINNNITA